MKIKSILFVLAFINITFIKAQDGPKVVVFNSPAQERTPSDVQNVLKFSVLEAFSGDFAFYYERILGEKISAEVGLGITLSDYITSLYNSDINVFDNSYEALFGASFSAGFRYYPLFAPEEFYVAPEFKIKTYNNNRSYDNGFGGLVTGKEKRTISVGRITFGYHYLVENNIFVDFYGGFGIGKIYQNEFKYISQTDSTGAQVGGYDYVEGSRLAPRIHLGLKVGIAF